MRGATARLSPIRALASRGGEQSANSLIGQRMLIFPGSTVRIVVCPSANSRGTGRLHRAELFGVYFSTLPNTSLPSELFALPKALTHRTVSRIMWRIVQSESASPTALALTFPDPAQGSVQISALPGQGNGPSSWIPVNGEAVENQPTKATLDGIRVNFPCARPDGSSEFLNRCLDGQATCRNPHRMTGNSSQSRKFSINGWLLERNPDMFVLFCCKERNITHSRARMPRIPVYAGNWQTEGIAYWVWN